MKVVLLAGGLGTRLMEETTSRPKPMVEVGGRPILWHIMQLYAAQGYNDFIVAAGYRSESIKDYFLNYRLLNSDLHVDFATGDVSVRETSAIDWRVQVVDTGAKTMTGGRLLRLAPQLCNGTFMATYGDGLSDVDVGALLAFHRAHGRIATLTAVHAPSQSRAFESDGGPIDVLESADAGDRVNGGFFVFEPGLFDYLGADSDVLETTALARLARDGELMAYQHPGFWQCMDTLGDRARLEALWATGEAPWAQLAVSP